MKTCIRIVEMMPYLPAAVKDAVHHAAQEAGQKTDDLELHRHSHSEKARVDAIHPEKRQSLKYVSTRTQDRDDEIVIPKSLDLREFRKYMHVLVNHNYSLLPVGSDEMIEADDFGIKALTNHADTGEGTLANVVWHLVSQGHLKSSSVGFVPLSYTKPGARDWDTVANGLQREWKEFDKARAEKSVSRIITGGVLLEHSFVSVPCNPDAEEIATVKGMALDDKVLKQLGWGKADALVVPVNKGMGTLSMDELRQELTTLVTPKTEGESKAIGYGYIMDVFDDHFVFSREGKVFSQGYAAVGGKVSLVGDPVEVVRRTVYLTSDNEAKGYSDVVVETLSTKAADKAQPCTCSECGAEADCESGTPCAEDGCKGKMQASSGKASEKKGDEVKAAECPECSDKGKCNDKACSAFGKECPELSKDGKCPLDVKEKSVKVVRPAPQVKVLYTPPNEEVISKDIGDAVVLAMARHTGRLC